MQSTQYEHVLLTCTGCQVEYMGDRQRLYCTEKCKWRAKAKRKYIPTPRGVRLCNMCKDKHYAHGLCVDHYWATRVRPKEEPRLGTCALCGDEWVKNRKSTTELCHKCVRRNVKNFLPNFRAMNKSNMYRALKAGVPRESIDLESLFAEQSWTCGICAEHVDNTLCWPHPRSVSTDHRVPLSKGGGHIKDNVQCAHLECNVRKGAELHATAALGQPVAA